MESKVAVLLSLILILLLFAQSHAEESSLFEEQTKTSPFEFMKALQGSRKGDKVKGLNELKKYLHHFGYLTNSNKVQTQGGGNDYDGIDDYDDDLESAIKAYQLNYNLKVTGTLDAETISKMLLPRCGVPDIIDGETRMRSGKGRKLTHTVSHYSFFPRRNRWPTSNPSLTYGFLNNGGQVRFVNVMNRAFNRWVNATSSRFSFRRVPFAVTANIKIGVYSGRHGDGFPFDGPYGTLAHAFAPRDGRLHFDGQDWFTDSSNPGPFQIHLETVAVHEIGHTLGLAHSSDASAIMFPTITPGQTKDIVSDDISAINDLYGN